MGLSAEAISGGWPGEKDFQIEPKPKLTQYTICTPIQVILYNTYMHAYIYNYTHESDHLSHAEMAPEFWILHKMMMRGISTVTWILM